MRRTIAMGCVLIAACASVPVAPTRPCDIPKEAVTIVLCEGEVTPRAGFLVARGPVDRATVCLEAQRHDEGCIESSSWLAPVAIGLAVGTLAGFAGGAYVGSR
jgi:hypothetical protein